MNKKKVYGLGLILMPIGALLLTACGSVTDVDNAELGLAEASDKYAYGYPVGPWTEYGLCNDGWDNDGNGLADVADPACHVLGPVRDLSLFPAPLGHNFFPDISVIPAGGPGSLPGGFRDRDQITRWMRFLTDTNGYTAGIDLFAAAIDSPMVPVPVPLFPKILQGTAAQGNNNNIDGVAIPLNAYLPPVPAVVPVPAPVPAAVPGVAVSTLAPAAEVGLADGVAGAGSAPAQGNTLTDSYKPDVFQAHGRNYGQRPRDMKIDDRQTKYAPRGGMDSLGRQSNMFNANTPNGGFYRGNNQANVPQGRSNGYGYGNNPVDTNGASSNNLNPSIQGTSLMGTDFGSPGDWPKGTTGPGYQNGSYGRQGNTYGQGGLNPQTNSWGQQPGANPTGNSWGQAPGAGYPQGNGYGQQGGYPQGNNWGQAGGYGQGRAGYPGNGFGQQGGYGQANRFGQQGGLGQGNSWGQPGGYGQGNSWGGQPGGYGQGNSWGGQPGAYGQGRGGYPGAGGNSWGQQAGSWPGARQ